MIRSIVAPRRKEAEPEAEPGAEVRRTDLQDALLDCCAGLTGVPLLN
jgi:hypothetical protein